MTTNNKATVDSKKAFKQRILTAGIWSAGSHVLNQAIRLGSNLIMTRLLAPEYFGLMAIANVFIFGIAMMSDLGLRQSLIQSKRFDEPFVNTIWTLQVMRGCVIWVFSLLTAACFFSLDLFDFWAKDSVYKDPLLPSIIAVIGFNAVIGGFESTKLATANRDLSLAKNVAIGLISQLISIAVMILWALTEKSVWPMVAASLVSTFITTVLSHTMLSGIKNRFHWDKSSFDQIFHFGKWVFISSIMGFFALSSDRLVLGALVDSRLLGLYAIAYFMAGSLKDLIGNVIHNVGFPALSEAYRDTPEKLKEVYYRLRLPFDALCLLGAGALFAAGQAIVHLLYDTRYTEAGWILEILSISLFQLRYNLSGECFMAMGKPRSLTVIILVDLLLLYGVAYSAFHFYGFKGVVWAVSISAIGTIPFALYFQARYKVLDWKREMMVLPLLPLGYGIGLVVAHVLSFIK